MAEDKTPGEKAVPADPEPVEDKPPEPVEAEPESISFKEFLESVPASQQREVKGGWNTEHDRVAGTTYRVASPTIELNCTNEICKGDRFFRLDGYQQSIGGKGWNWFFIKYICSNCRQETKTFSLAIFFDVARKGNAICYKFGELPEFGTPTPPRLLKLIDPDKEVFFKGRQCENHGLGVGAFAYYRRVVENQKNRILDKIISAAESLAAPQDMIDTLTAAKEEKQFKRALESVKDAVPPGLLINGQNPLTLLHSALSEGLHGKSDEECLERAHDIRLVLVELSDRLAQAVKDEKELNAAIGRMTRKK